MELVFLGNKYTSSNKPQQRRFVQLKYMGQAYQASLGRTSQKLTALLTYRGVSYMR